MAHRGSSPRRVATASAVGATIEWYDFFRTRGRDREVDQTSVEPERVLVDA